MGDGAFTERRAAAGAEKFVEFAARQDQEQSLPHWLGALALGTIQLAGGEVSELPGHAMNTREGDARNGAGR